MTSELRSEYAASLVLESTPQPAPRQVRATPAQSRSWLASFLLALCGR